jgi:adhesin transport system outer membrane protein
MRIPFLRPFAAVVSILAMGWSAALAADTPMDSPVPGAVTGDAAAVSGTAAVPGALTWSQVLQEALHSNPGLASARLAVKQASEGVTIANAGNFPALNASAAFNRSGTQALAALPASDLAQGQVAIGSSYSGGLQATWNIFNGFGVYFGKAHAEQLLAQAQAAYDTASATLLLNLRTGFNQLLYDQANVGLLKEISERYHKDTLYEQLEFQSGQTARWTFLKSQSDEASFNWSLEQNDLNLRSDQSNLASAMGRDPSAAASLVVTGTFASVSPPADDSADWAMMLKSHPALVMQRAVVAANEANLGQMYSTLYPSLTAQGSTDWSGGDTWGPSSFQAVGSLNLSFNLFNGGGNLAAIHQAQALVDASRQDLQTLEYQLKAGLDKAWAAYKADFDRLPTTLMATKAGEERFKTVGVLYTAGMDQYLDYEQAEQIYTSAQQQELSDRLAAAQSQVTYQNALGAGLESVQASMPSQDQP